MTSRFLAQPMTESRFFAPAQGGAGYVDFPTAPMVIPTALTVFNASSATITTDQYGVLVSQPQGGSTASFVGQAINPAADQTVVTSIERYNMQLFSLAFLGLRNSATGRMVLWVTSYIGAAGDTSAFLYNFSSYTTPSATTQGEPASGTRMSFQRIRTATAAGTISFDWSTDGIYWANTITVTKAAWIGAADQVGFGVWSNTSAAQPRSLVRCINWQVT